MAYTSPNSARATGYVVTAANWNEFASDIKWCAEDAPAVRVFHNAAQSIANNTLTVLAMNSERYDVGSCHSTVTNNSRLTVPSGGDGKYSIGASVEFASNATGYRQVNILLNGTTNIGATLLPTNGSTVAVGEAVAEYALAAGDYVECQVRQTSGGALNVTSSSNYSAELWMHWVRL